MLIVFGIRPGGGLGMEIARDGGDGCCEWCAGIRGRRAFGGSGFC